MADTTPDPAAVMALPTVAQATVGPDGERVAYFSTASGRNEVHVLDLSTGDAERWTDGTAPASDVWPLVWDADGEAVCFHRGAGDGSEAHDVYAVGPAGDPSPLVSTDGTTHLRGVSRDGATLLVRSNHEGSMDAYLADRPSRELTRLTDRDRPVWYPVLAPGGDRVAYTADGAVRVCDRSGDVTRTLAVGPKDSTTTPVDWAPDGDRLLVADDGTGVTRPGVVDVAAGDATWLGDGSHVEDPECLLPDGRRVLAVRQRDAMAVPVVYDAASGAGRELDLPEGVADFGLHADPVVGADRVLVPHAGPTRPTELLVADLATDEYETVRPADTGPFASADLATPAYERVPSDGVPATHQAAVAHDPAESYDVGTLFYDAGGGPSPLVVYPHGGPREADRREFDPRVQYLCRRGYAVLKVNYRGSSGRGRAFAEALYGDWGGAEGGDVATAVEATLARHGFLDPDRVAVYGGSFGGYVAAWQLVQYPGLYGAGAVVGGMTDLVDMYENTVPQFRSGFLRTHLGTPAENPDVYRERSPVTHAETLDAPLLLVHGENDPRVPVSQARRFREAIVAAGNEVGEDVEYHELGGSGHWAAADGVSRSLELLVDFLDRRL